MVFNTYRLPLELRNFRFTRLFLGFGKLSLHSVRASNAKRATSLFG
jgi:hypothetical protein